MTNLVSVFPSLATRPLYLIGESYAGTFVVSGISYSCSLWTGELTDVIVLYSQAALLHLEPSGQSAQGDHWERHVGVRHDSSGAASRMSFTFLP